MEHHEIFEEHRSLLFSIAYRMLGSACEAEDIVQDTFVRWLGTAVGEVASPKSFLSAATVRLSIDQLRKAKVRRATYIGPWLPEPLVSSLEEPGAQLYRSESLSLAFLALLERLSPPERAVFVLREVFEYDYSEIAALLGRSEAGCRQLLRRARVSLGSSQVRYQVPPDEQAQLAGQFFQALASGDLRGLEALLAQEVEFASDGGGRVNAARKRVSGQDKVARLLMGLARKQPERLETFPVWVNGRLGVASFLDQKPFAVLTLEAVNGKIQSIQFVLNPEKLAAVPARAKLQFTLPPAG